MNTDTGHKCKCGSWTYSEYGSDHTCYPYDTIPKWSKKMEKERKKKWEEIKKLIEE